jgi:hypothetical protein
VQLRYTAFAALVLGLALVSNQVFAARLLLVPLAPTSGAATCASGFTATPTSWDSKNAPDYVCKSNTPTCANGTALKLNDATTKGGYLRYTCGVPTPTTSGNPATTKTGVDNWNVLGQ